MGGAKGLILIQVINQSKSEDFVFFMDGLYNYIGPETNILLNIGVGRTNRFNVW